MTDTDQTTIERNIIGIALQSNRDLHDLAGVRAEWFTNPVHGEIWKIIQHLDQDGSGIDPQLVAGSKHLADQAVRHHITAEYLADCLIGAPYGHLGGPYTDRLRENYDRNRVAGAMIRGQQMLTAGADTREIRLETIAALQAVASESSAMVTASDAFDTTMREIDEIAPYQPTPWGQLNLILRGWRPGGLYVVGARPAVGKSLMLQRAALHLAKSGPVLLATMEMRPSEVMQRMVSITSGVPLNKLVGRRDDGTTRLSPSDWNTIHHAGDTLKQLPLAFAERVTTPLDVRAYARDLAARKPLAGIIVDYLQLMSSGKRVENRTQEVTQFTRQLKLMAMEFNCPVIVASQLNRNAANENRPPNIAELRESGSIEQDADAVILLHADPTVVADDGSGIELDAIVAKNRQGAPGVATLRRHGKTATISDDPGRNQL